MASSALLGLGALLLYLSHPNQGLRQRALPRSCQWTGYLLAVTGGVGWVATAGYRAGLFIAAMELMLLLAGLPLLSLLRRPAP